MTWLWYLLIFFLGASVGSFLNVLINRTAMGEPWVGGRSKCDHCGKELAWIDMVPVISYLVYRGRSRCCQQRLSYQHPVVETMVGLLFVWWTALSSVFFLLVTEPGRSVQPLFWLVTGIILLAISITDLYYGVIPLPFVLLGMGMTAVYRLILITTGSYQMSDLGRSIVTALGLAGFYFFLRAITRGKGMGDGDVWLALYMGLLLSWPRALYGTAAAFALGALIGIVLILTRVKSRKDTIPFGPFMVLGALVGLFGKF